MGKEDMVSIDDFTKIDIRCGRIIDVQAFPQARKPAYKLIIDFGEEIGTKKSCAQLPANYTAEQLKGRLIAGVVNLPPRKIGPEMSEVLVLGFPGIHGHAVLVSPTDEVAVGGRLF
jgi:tRNA-binding protein